MKKTNPKNSITQSNNLKDKVTNKLPSDVKEKIDENVNVPLNIQHEKEKSCCNKEVLGDFNSQSRGRNHIHTMTSSQGLSMPDMGNGCHVGDLGFKDMTRNNNKDEELIMSLGVENIKYDIKIDPSVEDRYTDKPVTGTLEPGVESPESRRQRMEIMARHGRLHPANRHLNTGPVVNPPLISPGTKVGFTPAGQRHQVDLNFQRPTWFNSEYARRQFDDATRINVSRMFHDMETGYFLPDCLDANVERRYFAERDLATLDATRYFEESTAAMESFDSSELSQYQEHSSLLETERNLIALQEYVVVRCEDFPMEVAHKLKEALSLKMTPLMFKKNPVIIYTLDKMAAHSNCHIHLAARALLAKVKRLFDVPQSQNFNEYFLSEVEMLRSRTQHMSSFDILLMTEEPPPDIAIGEQLEASREQQLGNSESDLVQEAHTMPAQVNCPNSNSLSQGGGSVEQADIQSDDDMVFVPVEEGDHWVDISSESSSPLSSDIHHSDSDSSYSEYEPRGDESDSEFESEFDMADQRELEALIVEEVEREMGSLLLNGMLLHGYPGFIVLNYFEYI